MACGYASGGWRPGVAEGLQHLYDVRMVQLLHHCLRGVIKSGLVGLEWLAYGVAQMSC